MSVISDENLPPGLPEAIPDKPHEYWMRHALRLAERATRFGEVPVGAVVVCEGRFVASAFNRREGKPSPLAHAELIAIEKAARRLGRWRLTGCTLYVTLEPCLMCAGAIVNSRIDCVVYGARDSKAGAVESLYTALNDIRLNHRPIVVPGVMLQETAAVLSDFFSGLRAKKKVMQGLKIFSEESNYPTMSP